MSDIAMATFFQDFVGDLTVDSGSDCVQPRKKIGPQLHTDHNYPELACSTISPYVNKGERESTASIEPVLSELENAEQLAGAHKLLHWLQESGLLPRVNEAVVELDSRFDEMEAVNSKTWVPIDKAADNLGVSTRTVRRALDDGVTSIREKLSASSVKQQLLVNYTELQAYQAEKPGPGRPRKQEDKTEANPRELIHNLVGKDSNWMPVDDAADRLGVSSRTVRRDIADGVPAIRAKSSPENLPKTYVDFSALLNKRESNFVSH